MTDYTKLPLKELKLLAGSRNIDCKETKEELVKNLTLYDQDKYVYPTTYEKSDKGFIVGICLKNSEHQIAIGKLIEKGEANSIGRYFNDRIHYWSSQKLI